MSRFQSFNADKLVSRFATHSQCAGRSPVEVAIAASQRAAPRRAVDFIVFVVVQDTERRESHHVTR